MLNEILEDAEQRMHKTLNSLSVDLSKIRTGRAHTSLLDHISVEYYGSPVPLNQVANVNVEDPRTLSISVWEKDMVSVVEKAIMSSDLGLNPNTAGSVIRINMPPLTEERRKDLVKVVKQEGEQAKVAIRNIRRDAISDFKELLKEKEISEDQEHKAIDDTQKLTDNNVKEVDKIIASKDNQTVDVKKKCSNIIPINKRILSDILNKKLSEEFLKINKNKIEKIAEEKIQASFKNNIKEL